MFMMTCPACGQRGISPRKKMFMMIWGKIMCGNCGAEFKWSRITLILIAVTTPVLWIVLFAGLVFSFEYGIITIFVAFAVMLSAPLLYPLRRVDD